MLSQLKQYSMPIFNNPLQHGPRAAAQWKAAFILAAGVHRHGHLGNTVCRANVCDTCMCLCHQAV